MHYYLIQTRGGCRLREPPFDVKCLVRGEILRERFLGAHTKSIAPGGSAPLLSKTRYCVSGWRWNRGAFLAGTYFLTALVHLSQRFLLNKLFWRYINKQISTVKRLDDACAYQSHANSIPHDLHTRLMKRDNKFFDKSNSKIELFTLILNIFWDGKV
jgi:hypothetical protein